MPKTKRRVKKKTVRKHKRRGDYVKLPMMITNKQDSSHHQYMPTAFRTKLYYSWEAVEVAGTTAQATYSFWANSPYRPGNVTGLVIGASSVPLAAPGTAVDQIQSISNTNCIGLSRLLFGTAGNGLYTSVHVIRSSIEVRYIPLALSDSLNVTLIPQKDSDSSNVYTQSQVVASPFGTSKLITTSMPSKDMVVRGSICIPKFLGMGVNAYLSDNAYGTFVSGTTILYPARTSNTGAQVIWSIKRDTVDNAVSNAPIPYRVQIEYDVVFQGLQGIDAPTG